MQEKFECCRVLAVPTPQIFAYFSDVSLQHGGGAPAILHIAITEYMIIALLRFIAAVRDGAVGVACNHPQMGDKRRGVLVPLPSCDRRKIDDICLLEILFGRGFGPVASLIAYSRSSQVDWAWVEPAQRWYLYHLCLGRFIVVPEQQLMTAGHNSAGRAIPGSEV